MKNSILVIIWAFCLYLPALASGPAVWTINDRTEVLKGEAKGVSIDQAGTIRLAPGFARIFGSDQPYIWSAASDAAGNIYLGTGSDGKIFKVDTGGKGTLFADLAELNVTALATAKSGVLFASTSPDGKVYRIDKNGTAAAYFDPKEKYIWSLAMFADGSLGVGTGEAGKIFRVKAANATPESSLLFDSSETHIISLIPDNTGNLYAGTDPGGLVLRISADGKPFALLDSPLREVHQLALGRDGSLYALALDGSAATAEPTPTPAPAAETKAAASPAPKSAAAPRKSRYDLSGARSAVYRIMQDGGSDLVWASGVSGFSIVPLTTGGVFVGTSDKGRIYSVSDGGDETLVLQSDAGQISAFVPTGSGLFAASSNPGDLYRLDNDPGSEGSYESTVLDARSSAAWGRIWWQAAGNVQVQTRSGNTGEPDETWSAWSPAYTDPGGGNVTSPKARFLQWRATLRGSAVPARLSEVNIAYLARNIAPEVLQIQVFPTNVGLVANPPAQIDPNIELSGLDPSAFGIAKAAVAPRRVYQRGATSLQWTAEDRNEDKLVYDVMYKELGETAFKVLRENIPETFFTVDGQSLADGRYVFKIVAKDSPSNPAGLFLSGDRISEPVDVDNTPPAVNAVGPPQIAGENIRVSFDAADAASYVARAEYSVNGGDWQPVSADDGIADGPRERFTFDVPAKTPGEYSITLRAFDVNANSGNARVTVRK